MQQIERYGVIALVFLLVTIVAVSFWGDSKSPGFWSRLTGRGGPNKMEVAKNAPTAERAVDNALPLNANPGAAQIAGAQQAQPPGANAQPQAPTAESAIANANGAVQLPGNGMPPVNAPMQQQPIAQAQPPQGPNAQQPNAQQPRGPGLAALPTTPTPAVTAPKPDASPAHDAIKTPRTAAVANGNTTGSTMEYVVQKGDSLASIAQKNLGSSSRWTEIQSMNGGIQPKSLRVGTKLKLPVTTTAKTTLEKSAPKSEAPAAKKAVPTATEPAHAGQVYVVHAGDTLRTIAEKKLGSADRWKDIVASNPGLDAHKLVVGTSIKLPASEAREAHNSGTLVAAATAPSTTTGSNGKPHVR